MEDFAFTMKKKVEVFKDLDEARKFVDELDKNRKFVCFKELFAEDPLDKRVAVEYIEYGEPADQQPEPEWVLKVASNGFAYYIRPTCQAVYKEVKGFNYCPQCGNKLKMCHFAVDY